jgi:hypothetical protein
MRTDEVCVPSALSLRKAEAEVSYVFRWVFFLFISTHAWVGLFLLCELFIFTSETVIKKVHTAPLCNELALLCCYSASVM